MLPRDPEMHAHWYIGGKVHEVVEPRTHFTLGKSTVDENAIPRETPRLQRVSVIAEFVPIELRHPIDTAIVSKLTDILAQRPDLIPQAKAANAKRDTDLTSESRYAVFGQELLQLLGIETAEDIAA